MDCTFFHFAHTGYRGHEKNKIKEKRQKTKDNIQIKYK
jgi:hypothetical protein